jgi:hypothetical protein
MFSLLPIELKQIIYIYSKNEKLRLVSKCFWYIGSEVNTKAKALLHKHDIPYRSNILMTEITSNQWIKLVKDKIFDFEIALFIFSSKYFNDFFVEVVAESASCYGNLDLLKWLINTVPYKNRLGISESLINSSLVQSSTYGHQHNVAFLLEIKADPKTQNYAAFRQASKNGHLTIVKSLISNSNIHAEEDYALCWASRNGHYEMVTYLLENGADLQARDGTPLHWAAEMGHLNIVNLLLDQGADIHSQEDHALRWASVHGHENIVETLLKRGADVHVGADSSILKSPKMNKEVILKKKADAFINWTKSNMDLDILDIVLRLILV